MAVSEATVQTQWKNATDILKEFDNYLNSNAEKFITHYDTSVKAVEGDLSANFLSALEGFRSSLNGAVGSSRGLLVPIFTEYAKVLNLPTAGGIVDIMSRIYDDFVTNSKTINSRDVTYASPSAGGSNTGDGILYRLTVDADGFDIENVFADAKTVTCASDEHSGADEHAEIFEIRGGTDNKDGITVSGSGLVSSLTTINANDSLLSNTSFSSDSATASPTSISDWTVGTIGNFEVVTGSANVYRGSNGDSTPTALKITANDALEQNLNVNNISVDQNVPHILQIAWNRAVGSASGSSMTIKIELGSQSLTTTVAGSETGWQTARLPFDKNLFFKNWNKEDPLVKITVAGMDTGYLLIDDILFAPMTSFDNLWYALIGGATPFLVDDVFTFTDSIATDSVLQYWLWRSGLGYLPSATGGAESITDP